MATYYGESGSSANGQGVAYVLTNQIKHGTEGTVYDIQGKPNLVAKIYSQKRYDEVANRRQGRPDGRAFMHAKLTEMVRMGRFVNSQRWASIRGHNFLAWPIDTLVDANGLFCGYVMPRVKGKGNLYAAVDEGAHDVFFGRGKYTWKMAIKIAKQLAFVVGKLHEAGIVVGDFNPQNFLLDSDGFVSFCDTDSYTISPTYKTLVAFPGFVAPELQGKPWSLTRQDCQFTKESDMFSLSCLIFQLLTGKHPFNGIVMRSGMSSVSQSSEERNITNGDCPYVHHGIAKRQPDAPDVFGLLFPVELRELCNRCFDYTGANATQPATIKHRPTAADWYYALNTIENKLKRCAKNGEHYYIPGAGVNGDKRCPWCERDEYRSSLNIAFRNGSGSTTSTASANGVALKSTTPNGSSTKFTGANAPQNTRAVASTTQSSGLTPAAAEFCKTALKWVAGIVIAIPVLAFLAEGWPIILLLILIGLFA